MFFKMGGGEADGSEFFQFSKPYRGKKTSTTMSLRVECSRFLFGELPKHSHFRGLLL